MEKIISDKYIKLFNLKCSGRGFFRVVVVEE